MELETVTIGSTAERDERRESTAAKLVVNREEITKYGDTSVSDVLRRVPGVTVTGTSGRGTEIKLRGLGNGYTAILINGEPAGGNFSLDNLPPDLIERIEVVRSAVADRSAQAIAGSINIVLRQTVRQAQKDIKATVSHDRGHPSYTLGGQVADKVGALSYSVGAELRREEFPSSSILHRKEYDASGRLTLDRLDDNRQVYLNNGLSVTPRLTWTVNPQDTLGLEGFALFQSTTFDWNEAFSTLSGTPPQLVSSDTTADRDLRIWRTRLNWTRKLAEGALLELKGGFSQFKRDQEVDYHYRDAQNALLRRRVISGVIDDASFTLNGKYRAPVLPQHTLSVGWESEKTRSFQTRLQADTVYQGLTPVNLDEDHTTHITRLALFAQDDWEVTPQWSVYGGLRWEGIETRSDGQTLDAIHNRSGVLSPILQSLWKVPGTKSDQVRLALSRTYKAPTPQNLVPRRYVGGSSENSVTQPDTQGNPNLKPEVAWGLDLAYERYVGDAGLLSANVFARQIKDVITQELFQDAGTWITRPVNGGQARSLGLELEAKLNLRQLWPQAPALDARSSVSRYWSQVEDVPGPNNRLAQQLPLSVNLGVDWRPDGTTWTLGGNFNQTAGGAVTLDRNQTAKLSVMRRLDTYALWKASPKTQWRLAVNNLLHQPHVSTGTYRDASGSTEQITSVPTGTVVRLTFEHKL